MLGAPNWPADRRLNFLICGVQKGGTSALDNYLREHPQICMAEKKEVHFFDNEELFTKACRYKYKYYHSFFKKCNLSLKLGESTPIYIWWEGSIERIYQYNSKIKLIVIFRSPVERAYSHWNMERQRGHEERPFSVAIRSPNTAKQHRFFSYVDRGFYARQLRNLYSFFPRDQVLCLRQEDLLIDPKLTLAKVTDHLGVGVFKVVKKKNVHAREYTNPIAMEDVNYLEEIYKDDISDLETLLDWDLSAWKQRSSYNQ